jgi:hypothetical protein
MSERPVLGSSLKFLKNPSVLVLSHPPQDRKNQSKKIHEIIGKKNSSFLTFFSIFLKKIKNFQE